MSRPLRKFSNSKVYHIIVKGIDDSDIFYDKEDKIVFLEILKICKKKFNIKIYAYCLMSNHVHLVLSIDDENLSKSMQSLMVRYVYYFNKKSDRKGPFAQCRFKSKNIEDQNYFLTVCRYVHRNPEKAGIEKTYNYDWSSYKEYVYDAKIIDKNVLLHYFGNNLEYFKKYTNKTENLEELMNLADFELSTLLHDDDLIQIILKKCNLNSVNEIINYFKIKENRKIIKDLKNIPKINASQLSRIIRVNRKCISKIWATKEPAPSGTKK